MLLGNEGKLRIENANRLLPKKNVQPATYYYASLEGSDYSFAYSLSDTDMVIIIIKSSGLSVTLRYEQKWKVLDLFEAIYHLTESQS